MFSFKKYYTFVIGYEANIGSSLNRSTGTVDALFYVSEDKIRHEIIKQAQDKGLRMVQILEFEKL